MALSSTIERLIGGIAIALISVIPAQPLPRRAARLRRRGEWSAGPMVLSTTHSSAAHWRAGVASSVSIRKYRMRQYTDNDGHDFAWHRRGFILCRIDRWSIRDDYHHGVLQCDAVATGAVFGGD